MKKSIGFSVLGLAIALLAGCVTSARYDNPGWPAATVVTNRLDPALLRPTTDPFVLGPGDLISLEILGGTMKESTNAVGMDGKIYFSILPGLDVWGLTLPQARARLEEELSKYISQPQVAISLKAVGSKYVWVLGRLNGLAEREQHQRTGGRRRGEQRAGECGRDAHSLHGFENWLRKGCGTRHDDPHRLPVYLSSQVWKWFEVAGSDFK